MTSTTIEVPFWTYSGAGNDFVIMRQADIALEDEALLQAVRQLCDRREGIGSDGLILLVEQEGGFAMRFYNPDGGYGALCGNGARCAVRAASDLGISGAKVKFSVLDQTSSGVILENGEVEVTFKYPTEIRDEVIEIEGREFNPAFIDVGSQHAVVLRECEGYFPGADVESLDLESFGKQLRWHPAFAPRGVNANVAEVQHDAKGAYLRIRTYERGVEGETLACGTGCISTAIAAVRREIIGQFPVRLLTQSGEFVEVDMRDHTVFLRGTAQKTSEGRVRISSTGIEILPDSQKPDESYSPYTVIPYD